MFDPTLSRIAKVFGLLEIVLNKSGRRMARKAFLMLGLFELVPSEPLYFARADVDLPFLRLLMITSRSNKG